LGELLDLALEQVAENGDEREGEDHQGVHGEDHAGAEPTGQGVGQPEAEGHVRASAQAAQEAPDGTLVLGDQRHRRGREDDALLDEDGDVGVLEDLGEHLEDHDGPHEHADGHQRDQRSAGQPAPKDEHGTEPGDGRASQHGEGLFTADTREGDRNTRQGYKGPEHEGGEALAVGLGLGQVPDGAYHVEPGDPQRGHHHGDQ
jgi:hypothetical protein